MAKDDFTVAPRALFWSSVIYSILGWGAIFLEASRFFAQSVIIVPPMNRTLGYILLLFNAFIGTAGVIIFSSKTVVRGDRITAYKLCRTLKRDYSLEDLKNTKLISGTGKTSPRIEIYFRDGNSITVRAPSSGFSRLWEYFGGNEKDIRPRKGKER